MNSISGAIIELLLTVTLWYTSQSACRGMTAGNHDGSVMRSGHRMLQQSVNVAEAANNFRDKQKLIDLDTDTKVFYKPEVPHDSHTSAPANTRPAHKKPGADFRDLSSRSRKSTGRVYHRSDEEVGVLDLKLQGLYSSSASDPERVLLASFHASVSDEKWRKFANSGANVYSETPGQTVNSRRRERKENVGLKTVLYHMLVKERVFTVRSKSETDMQDESMFGYGTVPRNLNSDKDDTKGHRYSCNNCGRFRKQRDADSSDKTTKDYTPAIARDVSESEKNGTTASTREETKSSVWGFSKASTVDTNQESNTTKKTADEYSERLLQTTTFEAEIRDNVSMTTRSIDDIITAADGATDDPSTGEEFTDQTTADDHGKARDSCSGHSDFGEYGIITFAVAVGLVALLLYVLGMVVVLRRLVARRKLRADLQCRYRRSGGPGGLDLGPGAFPLGEDPEGPITNSHLNLLGPDTSFTSESDAEVETTKQNDCHNVSTFLIRRESQQKAEERAAQDREQTHPDHVGFTNSMIVTEL